MVRKSLTGIQLNSYKTNNLRRHAESYISLNSTYATIDTQGESPYLPFLSRMAAITSKSALMMFYTEAETAGILRVSPRTLQRWRELGAGPAFTQARKGGRILYSDKAIEDYVAKRTFVSTAAADSDEVARNG